MNIRQLGEQIRKGQTSCFELTLQTLAKIKQHDRFNTLITVIEEALDEARELDLELARGLDRGPLHGIPIAYKDLFYTRGVRTTAGSRVYFNFVPKRDATVVERLRAAGAVCIGKTNLHELAYGVTSTNPHFGSVLNPLDEKRIAGGSSGGSAALIAGKFLPMALGTDTGGSIRIPASYCGVTGLKPTYGRVSRYGVLPLAFSLDHVGPLGSCVEDCAIAMNAMAGADPRDASCAQTEKPEFNLTQLPDLKGIRVGVPENFFFETVDHGVGAAVHQRLYDMQKMGATLVPVRIPDLSEANAAARIVQMAETAALYVDHEDASLFGDDVWALLQQGRLIMGHEYVNAQRLRTVYRCEFDRIWQQIDVLGAPTTPITAPLLDEKNVLVDGQQEDVRMASTRLVRAINYLGEPALSMPCAKDSRGLPIGLQLIGPPFSEPRLLQIAKTVEPAFA